MSLNSDKLYVDITISRSSALPTMNGLFIFDKHDPSRALFLKFRFLYLDIAYRMQFVLMSLEKIKEARLKFSQGSVTVL